MYHINEEENETELFDFRGRSSTVKIKELRVTVTPKIPATESSRKSLEYESSIPVDS
jgi:hypothetical protein